MSITTKKVYQDPRGRLHDETTGKFTRKPRIKKAGSSSMLEAEPLFFIRDDEKRSTYKRTGVHLEIERENDEIFANMMLVGMIVGVVWTVIQFLF